MKNGETSRTECYPLRLIRTVNLLTFHFHEDEFDLPFGCVSLAVSEQHDGITEFFRGASTLGTLSGLFRMGSVIIFRA